MNLPLKFQLQRKLFNQLKEEDIGSTLAKDWQVLTASTTEALEKQQVYLQDVDNFHVGDSDAPSGGTSNLHLPTVFTTVKTVHARFVEALLGVDPPFSIKAQREDGTDAVPVLEDLMRHTLTAWANNHEGIEAVVDQWVWDWCLTGTGIIKMRWETVYETWEDVQPAIVAAQPIEVLDAEGNIALRPQSTIKEVIKRRTERVIYGPRYEYINLEDFRMIGGKGNPDEADKVMHRRYFTESELRTFAQLGVFDKDAVEEVVEGGGDEENLRADSGIKIQRLRDSGVNQITSDVDLDRYEVIETCFKHDVYGEGITTDVVVWSTIKGGKILGATYLRLLSPKGKRPYAVAFFHKRKDQDFGVGLGEILHPLAKELDAMHNIRLDNAIFQSIPFFFYRASSGMDPKVLQIQPGEGIPLDNPQTDVYFPNVGNRTVFTAQEEQSIQGYMERLTGISDLSLGVMTGTQGATRTAAGVRALMGENNNNLSIHLRRLNKGWNKILQYTYEMLQNHVEPGYVFRITGEEGKDIFRTVDNYLMGVEVDFELSPNTANTNKSVQIETSQILMSLAMNPMNLQLGISGPSQVYNAQKTYLSALGIKDIGRYLVKPQDYSYVLEPREEFLRIVAGSPVQISPQADHDGFVAFARSMLDQQADAPTLTQDQIMRIIDQMKAHAAMKDAMNAQQAQVSMQNQMFQNSLQSPESMNPMGGVQVGNLFTNQV